MPSASHFSQVPVGKRLVKNVLAILGKSPEGDLRVLGCIGSLPKTLTGVTAHFWKTVKHSDFRIWCMTI